MRFSGREMVFRRLEIRFKATNVAEIESKSIRNNPRSSSEEQSDLGVFVVPSSDGDSEAGFLITIFKF